MDNLETAPRPLARALATELTVQEMEQVAGGILTGSLSFGPKKTIDADADTG